MFFPGPALSDGQVLKTLVSYFLFTCPSVVLNRRISPVPAIPSWLGAEVSYNIS